MTKVYRHRISIQSPPTTEDSYGQPTGDWIVILSRIPARLVDESERQFFSTLEVKTDKSITVALHHPRIEIKTSHRVIFHDGVLRRDRILDITAVLEDAHTGRELAILCTEHN